MKDGQSFLKTLFDESMEQIQRKIIKFYNHDLIFEKNKLYERLYALYSEDNNTTLEEVGVFENLDEVINFIQEKYSWDIASLFIDLSDKKITAQEYRNLLHCNLSLNKYYKKRELEMSGFKVGSKVFDVSLQEWGVITKIYDYMEYSTPIVVHFKKSCIDRAYRLDGKRDRIEKCKTLFLTEVKPTEQKSDTEVKLTKQKLIKEEGEKLKAYDTEVEPTEQKSDEE